jgi:hypothetical protein
MINNFATYWDYTNGLLYIPNDYSDYSSTALYLDVKLYGWSKETKAEGFIDYWTLMINNASTYWDSDNGLLYIPNNWADYTSTALYLDVKNYGWTKDGGGGGDTPPHKIVGFDVTALANHTFKINQTNYKSNADGYVIVSGNVYIPVKGTWKCDGVDRDDTNYLVSTPTKIYNAGVTYGKNNAPVTKLKVEDSTTGTSLGQLSGASTGKYISFYVGNTQYSFLLT